MGRTLSFLLFFSLVFAAHSQNNWEMFNNQPVKKMTTSQTDKAYKAIDGYKQSIYYYPNGYIEKIIEEYHKDKKLIRYYLYENDTLNAILEEKIKGENEPKYSLEKIERLKHTYLPLRSTKFELYDVVAKTNEGQTARITYTYNEKDRLTSSLQTYQIDSKTEVGFQHKIDYTKNGFINNTIYKHYEYDFKTKDSTFKTFNNTQCQITSKNKIGANHYKTTVKNKPSYFKITYDLFKKEELKKGIDYLELADLVHFYVDEIVREKNISDYVYQVISERVKDTTYQKSLISKNALQDEKWYVKKFYDEYIQQELQKKDLASFVKATEEALNQSHYFSLDNLNSFRMNAYKICAANKDYKNAEKFLKPLYTQAIKDYPSNPSEENGKLLGLMAKVCYQQEKNTLGDQILQKCNDIKLSMKRLSQKVEDQLKYYRYNYFLAQVYEAKNDVTNSKKLIEENLAYYNNLEEPYSKSIEPFATDYTKNEEMYQRL